MTQEEIRKQIKNLGKVSLWGVRKELGELAHLVDDDEELIGLLRGFNGATIVLLAATNKRLFFVDRRTFYGRANREISYLQIANVRYFTNLFFGDLIIDDQGEDHHFSWIYKKDLLRFANMLGDKISEYREKSVEANEKLASPAEEIKKLWQLKEKGALTLDEFKLEKKKILGQ